MSGFSLRVYYEDTDFSGLVYHASYLRFLERGRTEYLREAGVDQAVLFRDTGLVFVARRMTIDWLRPARMDDVLRIYTRLAELKGASVRLWQHILKDDALLLRADVLIAATAGGRATRLPAALRQRLHRMPQGRHDEYGNPALTMTGP